METESKRERELEKKVALTKHFYGQINTLFDRLIHKLRQPFL